MVCYFIYIYFLIWLKKIWNGLKDNELEPNIIYLKKKKMVELGMTPKHPQNGRHGKCCYCCIFSQEIVPIMWRHVDKRLKMYFL
jgi:hypothetical protein